MDTISIIGSGKPPAVFTTVTEKLQPRTLKTIDLFCKVLTAKKEAFFSWAQKDGGVQVEFIAGEAPKAKAETKFFLQVDGQFLNIEETSDNLSSIFFPWHMVGPDTRCKVVIALTKGFQDCSMGRQLAALIHEYFVHGVLYKQLIEFIRKNKNRFGEIPFYYYNNAREGGYLNGVKQHAVHGSLEISMGSKWGNYSGVEEFNEYVGVFLKELDEVERNSMIDAAKADIKSQRTKPSADTTVEAPEEPEEVTLKSVEAIKTVPSTLECLLQHFAFIHYGIDDPSYSQSVIAATWWVNHTQAFFPMIYAYQEYFALRHGNLFGLSREIMGPIVVKIPTWKYEKSDACKLAIPQPRDIYEAWAQYAASGGLDKNVGGCKEEASTLRDLFSKDENDRIFAYIVFRYRNTLHLDPLEENDGWRELKNKWEK